jgi:glycerol kinase
MAPDRFVLAVDQGTSSTKAVLVTAAGGVLARGSAPVAQSFPAPGWVEQDPVEIWTSVQSAVAACLEAAGPEAAAAVAAVGFSNQRESVVLWDRRTGEAVAPLVSWQDRRTAEKAARLVDAGHGDLVFELTGLPLDPMFSAAKMSWLLDEHDPDRSRARAGELCLGTVDAWLLSRFGGEAVIEIGNASRTQLLSLATGTWDEKLLEIFGIPAAALPRVVTSTGPFPASRDLAPLPDGRPVTAVLGDSHAALFAHAGWRPGVVKASYGTGSSVMTLATGRTGRESGVCSTVAWQTGDPAPALALEANVLATGRTLTWLAEVFGTGVDTLLAEAAATGSGGVTLVPAFGGLGAPWWDASAVPVLAGFTLGTGRAAIARAGLESVAFQVADVVAAMADAGVPVRALYADGGLSRNDTVLQLQADVCGVPVHRAAEADLSALGAAHLAGVAAGLWTLAELDAKPHGDGDVFVPAWTPDRRTTATAAWRDALARTRTRRGRG